MLESFEITPLGNEVAASRAQKAPVAEKVIKSLFLRRCKTMGQAIGYLSKNNQ